MAKLVTLSDSFNWHQTLGTSNSQYTVNRNPELFFMWFEFFYLDLHYPVTDAKTGI
jgi:hypothetical protein